MKNYIECKQCKEKIYFDDIITRQVIEDVDGYFCSEECLLDYAYTFYSKWVTVDKDLFERLERKRK